MSHRVLLTIAVVAALGLIYFAWNQTVMRTRTAAQADAGAGETNPPVAPEWMAPSETPAVVWDAPARWRSHGASGMRQASYHIPSAAGLEPAECAVYFFGPGEGGGVGPNLQRWMGEFQTPGRHDVTKLTIAGMAVSRVEVRGTYLAHTLGPNASDDERENWALLGAIAEGPNGDLFFKLVGPAATVAEATREFDAMIASLRKRPPQP